MLSRYVVQESLYYAIIELANNGNCVACARTAADVIKQIAEE